MSQRYSVVCEDAVAAQIEALAAEYRLPTSAVIQQLIEIGLEECDANPMSGLTP